MRESNTSIRPVAHDDEGYLRPQAWDEAKAAFGAGGDIACMLTRLEECQLASPRLLLAAAIHAFLAMTEADRAQTLRDYLSTPHKSPSRNGNVKHTHS